MKYPEVYSAVYGLSACCLMNNPRPPGQGRGPGQGKGPGQGAPKVPGQARVKLRTRFGPARMAGTR